MDKLQNLIRHVHTPREIKNLFVNDEPLIIAISLWVCAIKQRVPFFKLFVCTLKVSSHFTAHEFCMCLLMCSLKRVIDVCRQCNKKLCSLDLVADFPPSRQAASLRCTKERYPGDSIGFEISIERESAQHFP